MPRRNIKIPEERLNLSLSGTGKRKKQNIQRINQQRENELLTRRNIRGGASKTQKTSDVVGDTLSGISTGKDVYDLTQGDPVGITTNIIGQALGRKDKGATSGTYWVDPTTGLKTSGKHSTGKKVGAAAGGTAGGVAGGMLGASVGGYFGGPAGALVGEQIGSMVGSKAGSAIGKQVGADTQGDIKKLRQGKRITNKGGQQGAVVGSLFGPVGTYAGMKIGSKLQREGVNQKSVGRYSRKQARLLKKNAPKAASKAAKKTKKFSKKVNKKIKKKFHF